MTQFDVMRELYNDRSSWIDIKHYPSTVVCRRMLRLADFAAADELSYRELAIARGVSHSTIARHLAPFDLGEDFSENELDGESPEWLRPLSVRFDAERVSQTYRNGAALCTFAAAQPDRWRVIRLVYACPELSQQDVARLCGVCERSVRSYLQPVRLEIDERFNDLEVIY